MSDLKRVPNRHKYNYGFGRSTTYATKNALRSLYGIGKYATRASHLSRFKRFLKFTLVKDLRDLTQNQLEDYYEFLRGEVLEENVSHSYAVNLISTANMLLLYLSRRKFNTRHPSEILGRKCRRRKYPIDINILPIIRFTEILKIEECFDQAIIVSLCRFGGLRFRESLLLNFDEALRQYSEKRKINITRGTKGGRKSPRWVEVPDWLIDDIGQFKRASGQSSLIPKGTSLSAYYRYVQKTLLYKLKAINFNSIHDLRAAYACQRYREITGKNPPLDGGPEFSHIPDDLLHVLSEELGHGRVDVLHAYCG